MIHDIICGYKKIHSELSFSNVTSDMGRENLQLWRDRIWPIRAILSFARVLTRCTCIFKQSCSRSVMIFLSAFNVNCL